MDLYHKVEEILGQSYDRLTAEERKVIDQWQKALESHTLTVEDIKQFVQKMKNSIASDLVKTPEFDRILFFKFPNRRHLYLKARLENMLILEKFLFAKENIEQTIERYLESLGKK